MKKTTAYAFLLSGILITGGLSSCESHKTDDAEQAHTDLKDTEGDSKKMADDQNDEKFSKNDEKKDAEFAVAAADGGMLEVELGKLAQNNAASSAVKEFGKHIIEDHSKANEELKALATSQGIVLPEALSDKSQKEYDKLAQKTGHDFDKDYLDLMVSDHKEDISAFEKEADKGKDEQLKHFAAEKLPTLKHHLKMAEDTRDAVKK